MKGWRIRRGRRRRSRRTNKEKNDTDTACPGPAAPATTSAATARPLEQPGARRRSQQGRARSAACLWLLSLYSSQLHGDLPEGGVHVLPGLGGGLHVHEIRLLGILFGVGPGRLPLLGAQVFFVPYQEDRRALRLLPDLLHPRPRGVVGGLVRDVVHDDRRRGPPEINRCQGLVPLLAGSIPNLQLDLHVVQEHRLCHEGRADRGLDALLEYAFNKPQRQARLAD
mmetsp:Transcript_9449/g.25275  ORF Transcript_9449/g.25275 Transcript_9449/m.25275 type:complete len:225 (+) Transcript_9449:2-676(+)